MTGVLRRKGKVETHRDNTLQAETREMQLQGKEHQGSRPPTEARQHIARSD